MIDYAFYHDIYKGTRIDDMDLFVKYTDRATDIVNQLTKYRIQDLETTHETFQNAVKKAVCSEVEHLLINGETSLHGDYVSSVSVGNFSYQGGSVGQVSQATINHLKSIGLLYSGIDALC